MKIVVLKFGGTSVGSIEKIKKVAEIISYHKKKNYKVIVVSSAMSGVTNDLIRKSMAISDNFSEEEWKNLYKLSEDTFVEESESLKQGGAGAGLTDND